MSGASALGERPLLIRGLMLIVFLAVLVRTAWLCDDAYITLRTIDNFIHGHGLVWNVAERVQVFTHPLWFCILSLSYAVTQEAYFTTLGVCVVISLAALAILLFKTNSLGTALVAFVILLLSKAFVDFSTSGLDNPLSHLLIILFGLLYLAPAAAWTARRLFLLALLGALILLNRQDLLLIILPPIGWAWICALRGPVKSRTGYLLPLLLGLIPLIVWELFSLIYYGVPVPNTAFAKLGTGIPAADLFRQGACYFLDSLHRDPVTLIVIAFALLATLALTRTEQVLAFGLLFYLFYLLAIGGDFMSGRFLSVPLVGAVLIIRRISWPHVNQAILIGLLVIVALGWPWKFYPSTTFGPTSPFNQNGIADERGYYYPMTGLLTFQRGQPMPHHPKPNKIRQTVHALNPRAPTTEVILYVTGNIGFSGYEAGPRIHVVDTAALGDALLARLPAREAKTGNWRIGHFERDLPEGYLETLKFGKNVIRDPALAAYYDKLALVIHGPLFTRERWATIWELNTTARHAPDAAGVPGL